MRTDPVPSPELIGLYETYTASADSIGARLAALAEAANAERPLIVVTHGDIALYAGGGAPPVIEGFRLQTRGFKELAAISHLGPAVATVARMKALAPDGSWRVEAARLIEASRAAREANSRELWADRIALTAFSGREDSIARMVDYTCRRTEEFLWQALRDEKYLDAAAVRRDYLAGPAAHLPVPVNRVMVATFFLSGLDLAHRLIRWFDAQDLAWESAMVLVAGQQGRPTAGVTVESNSVAKVIRTVSRGRLPRRNLLIAPHAPVFPLHNGMDVDGCGRTGARLPTPLVRGNGHRRSRRGHVCRLPAFRPGPGLRAAARRRASRRPSRRCLPSGRQTTGSPSPPAFEWCSKTPGNCFRAR